MMMFRLDTPYHPIPGSRTEATFGAVMEMLLKTRIKLHLNASSLDDEDVNTYLAGVLVSYIDPVYLTEASRLLSQSDTDVYHLLEKADGRVAEYRIYKINADDLLVSLGLFKRFWREYQEELVRLKRYYSCACDCQRRIYGKMTAVADIQRKLARGPERYLTLLSKARSDYLHLAGDLTSDELSKELAGLEEEEAVKGLQNDFLDACSDWLAGSRRPDLVARLQELAAQLRKLSSGFSPPSFLKEIF